MEIPSSMRSADVAAGVFCRSKLAFAFVHDLAGTWYGDANWDGVFTSQDLIEAVQWGQYEDQVHANSTWARGDWNGDAEFTSADLVLALADGGYEHGPRAAGHAVPEPSAAGLLMIGIAAIVMQAIRGEAAAHFV
jgi:hypothetical protein